MFKRYMEYVRDNPQGLWFKRKGFGWGWTPVRWQGWAVVLVYVVSLVRIVTGVMEGAPWANNSIGVVASLAILTALLFWICYKKGESPRWQWGWPDKEK